MRKIIIPETLIGKELFAFLIANKSQLIAQKKSVIKHTDAISYTPTYFNVKGAETTKADIGEIPTDATKFRVKVAANTSLWADSTLDVLLRDSGKKSFKERRGLIPHLHDHEHKIDAELGDVQDIYYEDVALRDLGLNKSGSAQALIFETDIIKSYNEKAFNKYKAGKIKQHSIGLMYIKLDLAINDKSSEKEYDFWKKHIDDVINKEYVEERGFFWVVSEYKLMENSAVLFGSNILTPTLTVNELKDDDEGTDEEPSIDTPPQPPKTKSGFMARNRNKIC